MARRRPRTSPDDARGELGESRPPRFLLCLLLAVVTAGAYAQVVVCGFIDLDDPGYVSANPHVLGGPTVENVRWAFTTFTEGNWHPLTWLSLMLDAAIGGADPRVYHVTNLLLHVASTLLLFLVLDGMTGLRWRSGFVAGLFAVHPLHVESVAWIAERKDVLSGLFWMLILAAHARYAARPGAARYLTVFLALAIGLMAKPMLVTLPFVLLLLDHWPLGRFSSAATRSAQGARRLPVLEKLPLLALVAASSAVTLAAQRVSIRSLELYPLGERTANALVACTTYLSKMLWPVGLVAYYPHPHGTLPVWRAAASGIVLVAMSAAAILWSRKRPWLLVGWFWYLITLVPVIGLVQVGSQAMADRYTYIPLIGPFVAVAWEVGRIGRLRRRKWILPVVGAVTLLSLAALTWVQVGHWRTSVDLFEHALRVNPNNGPAHAAFATAIYRRGRADEAVAHYREALRLTPDFPDAHFNLTRTVMALGRVEEAAALAAEEQASWPRDPRTHVSLGLVAMMRKRYDEAAAHFADALRLNPDQVDAHLNLGSVLSAQGRLDEAIEHFSAVLRIDPADRDARKALDQLRARRAARR